MKKDGAGRANWGTTTDENPDKLVLLLGFCFVFLFKLLLVLCLCSLLEIFREAEENVNSEEKTAEKELVPEDVPASDEAVKEKEGDATNEAEQEKEEDKVISFLFFHVHINLLAGIFQCMILFLINIHQKLLLLSLFIYTRSCAFAFRLWMLVCMFTCSH